MKLFYIIGVVFFISVHSQNYTSMRYDMDNALPQNSIKDIIQDKYGFIWLSTENGILRYDGHNFLHYANFNFDNVSFSNFKGSKAKDSILVFNDREKGSVLISGRQLKTIFTKNDQKPTRTGDHGIYRVLNKVTLSLRLRPDIYCYYIRLNSGTYYFKDNTVTYVDRKTKKEILLNLRFPHEQLKNLFVHDDHIFVNDINKRVTLQLYKGIVSYLAIPSIYNDPATKVYWQQTTNQVFIINHSKIYTSRFEKGELKLNYLLKYQNITSENLSSLFFDVANYKLYLGSLTHGLNILSISKFNISKKNLPFEDEVSYAAARFSDSSVITQRGFEYYKDGIRKIFSPKTYNDKQWIFNDNSHNLIYLEENVIYKRYKASGFKKYDSVFFKNKRVEGVFKSNGMCMASVSDSKQNYLYIFENDNIKKIKKILRLKDNFSTVYRYSDDVLYIGCVNKIYSFSLSKNKIIAQVDIGAPLKHIIRTRDGNIWITTYNKGFYLLDNHVPIKMPDDENKYTLSAHYILEDNNFNFWIPTNNGLFKVKKQALLTYAKTKKRFVNYYRFTKKNDAFNNEFNGSAQPCANVLNDGQFVLPSMDGFVFFKPEEIRNYFPKNNQVYMERAKTKDGNLMYFKNKLVLKKNFKIADIFIDIPYYADLENIYLQAKLNTGNSSDKWENIKDDKKFSINNIGPGTYNLAVRFMADENGTFIYKNISIEIEPYFYQTTIFKILVFAFIFIIIIIIVQGKTYLLRLRLRETSNTLEIAKNESNYQKKLVESISHDITTPVKFIAMLSQKLYNTEDINSYRIYFDSIYKTSKELFEFTLELKEYTDLYKQNNVSENEYVICELVESKKLLFEEIAKQKNTSIYNNCEWHLKVKLNKNILSAIIHNIIDNAVKYTYDGEIVITTGLKKNGIEIHIADTGIGMSQEQILYYSTLAESPDFENMTFKNYGLGLHMVIQLIKKLNAKIIFQENTPKGTIVIILINI